MVNRNVFFGKLLEKLTSQGIRLTKQIHDSFVPVHVNDAMNARNGMVLAAGRAAVSDWCTLLFCHK